jgi:hypothetical protein
VLMRTIKPNGEVYTDWGGSFRGVIGYSHSPDTVGTWQIG